MPTVLYSRQSKCLITSVKEFWKSAIGDARNKTFLAFSFFAYLAYIFVPPFVYRLLIYVFYTRFCVTRHPHHHRHFVLAESFTTEIQGRSPFQKLGCPMSIFHSCLYKRSTTAVKRRRGKINWLGRVPPSPADYRGSGERRKLHSEVWGGDPAANDFGAFHVQFYEISRDF